MQPDSIELALNLPQVNDFLYRWLFLLCDRSKKTSASSNSWQMPVSASMKRIKSDSPAPTVPGNQPCWKWLQAWSLSTSRDRWVNLGSKIVYLPQQPDLDGSHQYRSQNPFLTQFRTSTLRTASQIKCITAVRLWWFVVVLLYSTQDNGIVDRQLLRCNTNFLWGPVESDHPSPPY